VSGVRLSDAPLARHDGSRPPWPGTVEQGLHLRRTPWSGGEPALFVHGLGGSATNWTDLMGLLSDRLDGEAVDLPGFGHSPPPADGRYTVGAHARAVVGHLERSGRGPVHLFGNSLGGAVSTRVAARRPDLVRSLTLVSPALPALRRPRGSGPLPLLLLPALTGLVARRLGDGTPEERAEAVVRLCFADPRAVSAQRRAEAVEEVRRRSELSHSTEAFARSLRGLVAGHLAGGSRSLWTAAAQVQAPTLLVWGRRDRLVDVSLAPRAAATYPDCRLLVLERVGHVAQMERPETVARAFVGLLEDLAERERPAAS
jgi:pimeloyl-ACP methyl ester carboxylesterase